MLTTVILISMVFGHICLYYMDKYFLKKYHTPKK